MENDKYLTKNEISLRLVNSANEHIHALEKILALAPPLERAQLGLDSALRTLREYYASEFKKVEELVKQDPPKLLKSSY